MALTRIIGGDHPVDVDLDAIGAVTMTDVGGVMTLTHGGVDYPIGYDSDTNPTTGGRSNLVNFFEVMRAAVFGSVLPNLISASISSSNPNKVTLYFDRAVKFTSVSGLIINVNDNPVVISSASGSQTSTMVLSLNYNVQYGDTVSGSYDSVTGNIASMNNSPIASIASFSVTNNVPTLATFLSASIEDAHPDRMLLNYSKAVEITNGTGFLPRFDGVQKTITNTAGSGTSTITLYLSASAVSTDLLDLAYSAVTGNVIDYYTRNAVATFTTTTVSNNVAAAAPEAATYYVDYDSGSDSNSGRSSSAAWKHCKGDVNATGTAAATSLQPDDIVSFKGGVYYRGSITVPNSGTSGHQIQFRGDMWGTSTAIIDGSKPLTGWTQCTNGMLGGNPNYANIYYTNIAAADYIGIENCNLHEGDNFLYASEYPIMSDPFFWDSSAQYLTVPSPISNATRTSITDATFFTQSDAHYWDGSSIAIWYNPNEVVVHPILTFNPATHTVTFADTNIYTDRATKYAIYNSPFALTSAGYYYTNPTANGDGSHTVYVWPTNPANLTSNITISTKKFGIDTNSRSYITVKGFIQQKVTASAFYEGIGIGACAGNSNTTNGIIIQDNIVRHNYQTTSGGRGGIFCESYNNCLVDNNTVQEVINSRGIFLSICDSATVTNNIIYKSGSTSLGMYTVTNSTVMWNDIQRIAGTHANGITTYLGCNNVLIAWNKIAGSTMPITFQNSGGIYYYRNLIDMQGTDGVGVSDWGKSEGQTYVSGPIWFINNTLVRSVVHGALKIAEDAADTYVSRGNIIDGGNWSYDGVTTVDKDYNLYVGLAWWNTSGYGWSLNTHEIEDIGGLDTFVDYAFDPGNLHLKAGGRGVGTNGDLSSYIATMQGLFPGVDFMKDLDGVTVPSNNRDLGAYIKV